MDEVFGPQNFRNCITRKKCNPKNYTRKKFGNVSDYILFYTKSEEYVWNRPVEAVDRSAGEGIPIRRAGNRAALHESAAARPRRPTRRDWKAVARDVAAPRQALAVPAEQAR